MTFDTPRPGATHGATAAPHGTAEPAPPTRLGTLVRWRAVFVHVTLVLFAVAILARAAEVQLIARDRFVDAAVRQQLGERTLPAMRGAILDERGAELAQSREVRRIEISPNQVIHTVGREGDSSQAQRIRTELTKLAVPRRLIERAMDTTQTYVLLPKRYLPNDVATLTRFRGVRQTAEMQRLAVGSDGLQALVGRVGDDGNGRSGLELALDSVLRGIEGERRGVRDRRNNVWETPGIESRAARTGHTVELTVNARLQEIVERELLATMQRTGASGGDVVVLDPHTGALLALVGARNGAIEHTVTPLTQPYEPGSVLKPFIVGRLLDLGRTRLDEVIDTNDGILQTPGRTIRDEHKAPRMSVFDVVRWSSNVGTARLVDRLDAGEEYELLRDLGFGTPTGVSYPSESHGTLRSPHRPGNWSVLTPVSLAIGYELAVTPVQLAVAYAAIANGGEIVEPALVARVLDADGNEIHRHRPRRLRRVLSPAAAEAARRMIKAVVDSGTAKTAQLDRYDLGGKSGTSQRSVEGERGYRKGENYNATFASVFPMADPQLVVIARLIDPQSAIYGGVVAGPLVRDVIRDAIAARDAALDRTMLARVARVVPVDELLAEGAAPGDTSARRRRSAGVQLAQRREDAAAVIDAQDAQDALAANWRTAARAPATPAVPGRVLMSLPLVADADEGNGTGPSGASVAGRTAADDTRALVPDVRGLDVRTAVRRLHDAGFRVSVGPEARSTFLGTVVRMRPAAGTRVRTGITVTVEAGS